MSELDDLRERLSALESQVTELTERVTDTHTLAAHADRDVAEFRAEVRHQTRQISLSRLDMEGLRTTFNERLDRVDDALLRLTHASVDIRGMLQELIDREGGQPE